MTEVRRVCLAILSVCLLLVPTLSLHAQEHELESVSDHQVKLSFNRSNGTFLLHWPDGTTIGPITASIVLIDGQHWAATDLPQHEIKMAIASPPGLQVAGTREREIRSYGRSDAPELRQRIYLEPGKPFALTALEAVSHRRLNSRRISPVVLATSGAASFVAKKRPTVLFVPDDNDMWVHYNEPIDATKDPDSYEVTAIFDNASRRGMVLGSVTHDLWRTGVVARELGNGTVNKVEVYGGATGEWTHDIEPHGVVMGKTIRSPLIMVGYFSDWRDGMETYGRVNAQIHPPLAWSGGVPFGWNSWSAYLGEIDGKKYIAAADFIRSELEPRGFKNDRTAYVNLDAGWTRMKNEELIASAKHIHAQGQKAGIYFSPFSYWSDDLSKKVEGTNGKYTYGDILLRDSNGNPLPKLDGARPLDPTHPGTIERIDYELARFVAWGYDAVKLDFVNCASLEGRHYSPSNTTGVAAYAYGMQRIEDDLWSGDSHFIRGILDMRLTPAQSTIVHLISTANK